MRDGGGDGKPAWRSRLRAFLERRWLQNGIIALIVINAITLGLETSPSAMAVAGSVLPDVMLNLFVAVIVGAMQSEHEAETASAAKAAHDDQQALLAEVRALRAEMRGLRAATGQADLRPGT